MNVRRSLWSYLEYLGTVGWAINDYYLLNTPFKYLSVLCGLGGLIVFIRLIFRPNYFEIGDNRLTIHRDLFYSETMDINDIEKIVLEEGIFSKSLFKLKEYKLSYDFNYFKVNDKDFDKMCETLKFTKE